MRFIVLMISYPPKSIFSGLGSLSTLVSKRREHIALSGTVFKKSCAMSSFN